MYFLLLSWSTANKVRYIKWPSFFLQDSTPAPQCAQHSPTSAARNLQLLSTAQRWSSSRESWTIAYELSVNKNEEIKLNGAFEWKDANSVFPRFVLSGSAEALGRWRGKMNQLLTALFQVIYLLKIIKNRTMGHHIIFETSYQWPYPFANTIPVSTALFDICILKS